MLFFFRYIYIIYICLLVLSLQFVIGGDNFGFAVLCHLKFTVCDDLVSGGLYQIYMHSRV